MKRKERFFVAGIIVIFLITRGALISQEMVV